MVCGVNAIVVLRIPESLTHQLRPVYTKRQDQCRVNSTMMLAIQHSLKTLESLQNGLQLHSPVTLFVSIVFDDSYISLTLC